MRTSYRRDVGSPINTNWYQLRSCSGTITGTAGEVRYIVSSGILSGDVDGDGVTDWQVNIQNKAALTADDFIF